MYNFKTFLIDAFWIALIAAVFIGAMLIGDYFIVGNV